MDGIMLAQSKAWEGKTSCIFASGGVELYGLVSKEILQA
jgi:hypothetical protein